MRSTLLAFALALAAVAGVEGQTPVRHAFIVIIDGEMSRPELARIRDDIEAKIVGINCHPTNPQEFGCQDYTFTEDPTQESRVLLMLAINGDTFVSVNNLLDRSSTNYEVRYATTEIKSRADLTQIAIANAYHNFGALKGRVLYGGDRAQESPILPTFVDLEPLLLQ